MTSRFLLALAGFGALAAVSISAQAQTPAQTAPLNFEQAE